MQQTSQLVREAENRLRWSACRLTGFAASHPLERKEVYAIYLYLECVHEETHALLLFTYMYYILVLSRSNPKGRFRVGLRLGLGKSLFPVGRAKDQRLPARPIATAKK